MVFDNSDVVYLITPDRFSNGDIKMDLFEDLKETNVNRGEDYSRHGGDLMGIYNNVKYKGNGLFSNLDKPICS